MANGKWADCGRTIASRGPVNDLLGSPPDLTYGQMGLRAVLVFVITLVYLRLANKRFLGRYTAFDAVLAIIFGSVVSRGINGQADFGQTMVAGAVLLVLHWTMGAIALRSRAFSRLVKGTPRLLVKHGKPVPDELRRAHISEDDLLEDLRYEGGLDAIEDVEEAYLEPNGKISVIDRKAARQRA